VTERCELAVVEKAEHRLAFYALPNGRLIETLPMHRYPHEMALAPDGRTAYVAQYGAAHSRDPAPGGSIVVMVDLMARRLLGEHDFAPFRRLHGLQCDAAGRLFVLAEADDVLIAIERPKGRHNSWRCWSSGGRQGHLLTVTRDGATAFCTNLRSNTVTRIDLKAEAAPLVAEPGPRPEGLCLSADEESLFVLMRGDGSLVELCAADLTVRGRARLPGDASRIYCVGTDRLLIACYETEDALLLDRSTLALLHRLDLGGKPTAASQHPSGAEAYISLEDGQIVRVDLTEFRETGRFPVGREPDVSIWIGNTWA
jgi:sugar lactone lactonase YvrE